MTPPKGSKKPPTKRSKKPPTVSRKGAKAGGKRKAAPRKKAAPDAAKGQTTSTANPPNEQRAPGRPSAYREEFALQAEKLCRLMGATDQALAKYFEISVATLNTWKKKHPEFLEALKRGKDPADAEVANALYRRALGFAHPAVRVFGNPRSGDKLVVNYIEHYPPDTTACIFWLKNRQPERWRERQDHRQLPIPLDQMSEEQLGRIVAGEDPLLVLAESRGAR